MRFERATQADAAAIGRILQEARRFLASQGVDQWQQNGPTPEETSEHISRGVQYLVRAENGAVAGVCIILDRDPDYDAIEGAWLTQGKYLAVHRVAVAPEYRGHGIPDVIYRGAEALAGSCGAASLRADTHRDNARMRRVFARNGFVFCGRVFLGGSEERLAFEKICTQEHAMEKKVVAATGNKNKVREFREVLKGWTVLTAAEAGFSGDVEETGSTFAENALIKARAVAAATHLPALADDSGLCVAALGGAPGVYSARYSGGDDADNRVLLLKNMQGVSDRRAYFASAIALCFPDGRELLAEGRTEGEILEEERGENGFGYDCLFFSCDLQKSFGEASDAEKNGVSHRGRALRALEQML